MEKGKESEINRAAADMPKSGHRPPAPAAGVGNETKADVAGALMGQPTDKNPLAGAMRELHDQHPHDYCDHGPHHGTSEHVRHMPLHGLKPAGG